MDVDFFASKAHSSKHFSAHLSSGNHAVLDSSDVDNARTYFTCPFCYVDTELSVLCNHLQEEHCFDVRNAVCPICALNLGKDVVGHFQVHHATSIKTQRTAQKSGFWSFYSGRSSLGSLSTQSGTDNHNGAAPDPLLSPFLFSIPYSEAKDDKSLDSSTDDVSSHPETESSKPSLSSHGDAKDQDSEELRQRVAFCQQLVLSAIF